jgi:hypothetical protein
VLTIHVPIGDLLFDEANEEFLTETFPLDLEHSLASLSKWESVFEKPFLASDEKTVEELLGYVKAMTLTPNVPDSIYEGLTQENVEEINLYMQAKMTATWFSDAGQERSRETITAELIYYWMIALGVPFECQYWHLNKLMTLLRVCNVKNTPPKPLSPGELAAKNRRLNAERKAALRTSG